MEGNHEDDPNPSLEESWPGKPTWLTGGKVDTALLNPVDLPAFPGYEILGELGRGGMGVVYLARQTELDRVVALKVIHAGLGARPNYLARFRNEARAVASLHHPHIVQIYEVGEHNGQPFFSLEYIDGGSLAQHCGGQPMGIDQAARLVATLARAIHAAHEKGLVHRDLKPANVLLACCKPPNGIGLQKGREAPRYYLPKINDFGLAKQLNNDRSQTQTGDILGTPSYMAPEQATGRTSDVGPGTDVYALGAILYELLTGRPPFRGSILSEVIRQVCADEPVAPSHWRPQVPRDLEAICLQCLQKEASRRYASALALAKDLDCFLAGEATLARPAGWLLRSWRRWRGLSGVLLAATLLAFVVVLSSGFLLSLFLIVSQTIDHSRAEIWMGAPRIVSIDLGSPIPDNYLLRLLSQPEVSACEVYLQGFANWYKPGGGTELCMVVGSRLDDGALGTVKELTPELRTLLTEPGAAVIDESDVERLGISQINDTAYVAGKQVRIVGMTRGLHSLSGPYVFCSNATAQQLLHLRPDLTTYVLARCHNPEDSPRVVARLRDQYPDISVFTSSDFSTRSKLHWIIKTKAGLALAFAWLLAGIGGAFAISPRIYAFNAEQIRRRARQHGQIIPRWRRAVAVLLQVFGTALAGTMLAAPFVLVLVDIFGTLGALVLLPLWVLIIPPLLLNLGMIMSAGLFAIWKLLWLSVPGPNDFQTGAGES